MVAFLTEPSTTRRAATRATTKCYTLSVTSMTWALGERISRDPIEDGDNTYAYVRNCVIDFIDILGLQYDYSVYLGVGPDGGVDLIRRAASMAENAKKEYQPPKGANKKCRFTIENGISSARLRGATKDHDAVHFYGHGRDHRTLRPNRTPRNTADDVYITRTALVFADGEKYLSDVLTEPKVRATFVVTWVCYDKYVDENNPSGIPVCKPLNSATGNLSFMLNDTLNVIIGSCKNKKCCKLE